MALISRKLVAYVGIGIGMGLIAGITTTILPSVHPVITVGIVVCILGIGFAGIYKRK